MGDMNPGRASCMLPKSILPALTPLAGDDYFGRIIQVDQMRYAHAQLSSGLGKKVLKSAGAFLSRFDDFLIGQGLRTAPRIPEPLGRGFPSLKQYGIVPDVGLHAASLAATAGGGPPGPG